jgi:ATP-dependent RNA helicase DeaD
MAQTFQQLGVPADLIQGIEALGIKDPTPVQLKAIPFLIQDGGDLIAQAQTGTGKTAAFGLPLLTKINPDKPEIQGLVIAPTRELAKQVGKQLFRFTKFCDYKLFIEVAAGGDKIDAQALRLERPTHIVVATPGRLMDLLELKAIDLQHVKYLVLDEADEMLSLGFREELTKILKLTATRKATWLFSATFQDKVQRLVTEHMSAKAQMLKVDPKQVANPNISHYFAICSREEKTDFVCRYLSDHPEERGLIFCRTRSDAISLGGSLEKAGVEVDVLQGDLSQRDRDKVMRAFTKKRSRVLIATDVAARGIDVEGLSFVIQYQLPDALQYYTHRSGRTARAGKKGVSITLVGPKDRIKINKLESELNINFKLFEHS